MTFYCNFRDLSDCVDPHRVILLLQMTLCFYSDFRDLSDFVGHHCADLHWCTRPELQIQESTQNPTGKLFYHGYKNVRTFGFSRLIFFFQIICLIFKLFCY